MEIKDVGKYTLEGIANQSGFINYPEKGIELTLSNQFNELKLVLFGEEKRILAEQLEKNKDSKFEIEITIKSID